MAENQHIAYTTMSLLDFQERFPDEQECYDYLVQIRFPSGFSCPQCGSYKTGIVAGRRLWQCKNCRAQTSVTSGTIFHRTKTPLHLWFWAVFLVAKDKRGHSALQLSKDLNISYDRAWLMNHKIRHAMAFRDSLYQLNGAIEMDDAYFGAPDTGRIGRSTRRVKALVAVSLTDDNKPLFANIRTVKRLDSRCVKKFATTRIMSGSTVHTDGLKIYRCLSGLGFFHKAVPVKQDKAELLRWVHIVISNAKAFITGTFHGLGDKHIQRYLDEFCYRFNRRFMEHEMFDRLLLACATAEPIGHDELTR